MANKMTGEESKRVRQETQKVYNEDVNATAKVLWKKVSSRLPGAGFTEAYIAGLLKALHRGIDITSPGWAVELKKVQAVAPLKSNRAPRSQERPRPATADSKQEGKKYSREEIIDAIVWMGGELKRLQEENAALLERNKELNKDLQKARSGLVELQNAGASPEVSLTGRCDH